MEGCNVCGVGRSREGSFKLRDEKNNKDGGGVMEKKARRRKTVEQLEREVAEAKARIELAKLKRQLKKERRNG